jgi:hypothetical protein
MAAVVIFAVGSFPPLNDVPLVPIGLYPFIWMRDTLSSDVQRTNWATVLTELPAVLLITVLALAVMSIAFAPLVCLGWFIRRRFRF